jgi:hypothetical protein
MNLKALILSLFAVVLVLGCTKKSEPAEETIPPAPEFDTMDMDDTSMDENAEEFEEESNDDM